MRRGGKWKRLRRQARLQRNAADAERAQEIYERFDELNEHAARVMMDWPPTEQEDGP